MTMRTGEVVPALVVALAVRWRRGRRIFRRRACERWFTPNWSCGAREGGQ